MKVKKAEAVVAYTLEVSTEEVELICKALDRLGEDTDYIDVTDSMLSAISKGRHS